MYILTQLLKITKNLITYMSARQLPPLGALG